MCIRVIESVFIRKEILYNALAITATDSAEAAARQLYIAILGNDQFFHPATEHLIALQRGPACDGQAADGSKESAL